MGGDERHVSRTRTLYLNWGYELWRETKQGRRVEEEGFGHVIYVSQENAATCGGGSVPCSVTAATGCCAVWNVTNGAWTDTLMLAECSP